MANNVKLNKPNQLISILPEQEVGLIQRKSYNVFLREAQQEVKFGTKYEGEIKEDRRYIFSVSCNELEKKTGIKKRDYNYIKKEMEDLMSIVISVVDKENKNNWELFHLIDEVTREDDTFRYVLPPKIVKSLKNQEYFTQLDLLEIAKLKSKYSTIIYELAIRYENYKIPKMSIEEIRKLTNTQNKYKRIYNFKKKVLNKACDEITEKTNINISYTAEKTGRKITHIDFDVEIKEDIQIAKKETKPQGYSPKVLKLFKLLPTEEQVSTNKDTLKKLVDEYKFEYIKADINFAKNTANPNDFMAFIVGSCQQGHFGKAMLEKQKKKEKLAKKKKQANKRKEQIKKEISKKAQRKAKEEYKNLSKGEKEEYLKGYNEFGNFNKLSKKEYIIGFIQDEIEKNLKEEEGIIV